jgi:hypothetical protein
MFRQATRKELLTRRFLLIGLCFAMFVFTSCVEEGGSGKDGGTDASDGLNQGYQGKFSLTYTNFMPPVDATGCVNVAVDKVGKMTFSTDEVCTGEFSYDVEAENIVGTIKYEKTGSYVITPSQCNEMPDAFLIDKIAELDDLYRKWIWCDESVCGEYAGWGEQDPIITDSSWHGCSAFSKSDALTGGAELRIIDGAMGEEEFIWVLELESVATP